MQTIVVVIAVLVAFYLVFKIFKAVLKWVLLAVIVVLAIAFFSNPDFEDHRKELTSATKGLSKEIKEKKIAFDDYKIFSLTKKKVNGEEKIVGVGVFGKVWYFDKEN